MECGSTHKRAPAGFAGISIGLALTLTHLISIPVTNTSVNPARSTGPAIFVGDGRSASFGCSGSHRSLEERSRAFLSLVVRR
jgi:glycerol uptake facilitator-like aquaporin